KLTTPRLKLLLISGVSSGCRVTAPPVNKGLLADSAGISLGLSTFAIGASSFQCLSLTFFRPLADKWHGSLARNMEILYKPADHVQDDICAIRSRLAVRPSLRSHLPMKSLWADSRSIPSSWMSLPMNCCFAAVRCNTPV